MRVLKAILVGFLTVYLLYGRKKIDFVWRGRSMSIDTFQRDYKPDTYLPLRSPVQTHIKWPEELALAEQTKITWPKDLP